MVSNSNCRYSIQDDALGSQVIQLINTLSGTQLWAKIDTATPFVSFAYNPSPPGSSHLKEMFPEIFKEDIGWMRATIMAMVTTYNDSKLKLEIKETKIR